MTYQDMLRRAVLVGMGLGILGVCSYGLVSATPTGTLTREPLALAFVIGLGIAVLVSASVGVAALVLHLKPRAARVASAADAAGPDADFGPVSGPDQDIDVPLDGPGTGHFALIGDPDSTGVERHFAQDVACYLASERTASGVRYWPAPPVVPGRGER